MHSRCTLGSGLYVNLNYLQKAYNPPKAFVRYKSSWCPVDWSLILCYYKCCILHRGLQMFTCLPWLVLCFNRVLASRYPFSTSGYFCHFQYYLQPWSVILSGNISIRTQNAWHWAHSYNILQNWILQRDF